MRLMHLILVFFISGCSFQSNQYELLKTILIDDKSNSPALNWTINWTDINYRFFAINNNNYIYFANYDDYFIEFDGWQITKVNGFIPGDGKIEIEIDGSLMRFTLDGALISSASCNEWLSSQIINGYIEYNQSCRGTDYQYNFKNTIIINDLNHIIGLKYKIHPDYPSMKIKMDDYHGIYLTSNK
jgi:hypothetical protein